MDNLALQSQLSYYRVSSCPNLNLGCLQTLNPPPKNLIVEVISGPEGVELKSYVVESGTTRTFGGVRRATRDITGINDRTMSGPHFRIVNEGGRITLIDCESLNGTKVNGRRVSEETIEEESIFQAGRTRFQVRWEKRSDDSEQKLNPIESSSSNPTQVSSYSSRQEPSSVVNPSLPGGSSHISPFESSISDAPSSYFRKSAAALSDFVKKSEPPDDGLDATIDSVPDITSLDPAVRLFKRTSSPATDFKQVIHSLANHLDFFAIAHLAKLELKELPSGLGIPLYPHLDSKGSAYPVAFRKIDWLSHLHDRVAERLAQVDGLLLVTCRNENDEDERALQELGIAAVPGFSERGGFVPWCWPSGAARVLDSMSDATIASWLGSPLSGLVFPSRDRIVAYTSRDLMGVLSSLGFS